MNSPPHPRRPRPPLPIRLMQATLYLSLSAFSGLRRGAPLGLAQLEKLRRTFNRWEDPLAPPHRLTRSSGRALRNPTLSRWLADETLGFWVLSAGALNHLEEEIAKKRPERILEFGSGLSTICLARFLHELYGPGAAVRLLSIEQDPAGIPQLTARLAALGLAEAVRIMHAPLTAQPGADTQPACYDFAEIKPQLRDWQPDLVLIDGPSGPPGIRQCVLSQLLPEITGPADFFLDDALRDGELQAAAAWETLDRVTIEGIYPIGRGLLQGKISKQD